MQQAISAGHQKTLDTTKEILHAGGGASRIPFALGQGLQSIYEDLLTLEKPSKHLACTFMIKSYKQNFQQP